MADIPVAFRAGRQPTITVYVVCLPANAKFSVWVSGVRKFWGGCANGPGSVAGGFALRPTDRVVTLDVGTTVRWTIAMTRG